MFTDAETDRCIGVHVTRDMGSMGRRTYRPVHKYLRISMRAGCR